MRRAALLALLFACAHASPAPAPERGSSGMEDSFEPQRYVSARAYKHYLDALLARGADDFAAAASELREALLYDPESPHLHTVLAEVLVKQGHIADGLEKLLKSVYGRSER